MIRYIGIMLCAFLTISGCNSDSLSEGEVGSALKLYVFDCGMLRYKSIESFAISDDETDIRDLIVPCYVVEHGSRRLLWDGGLPSKLADIDGWQGEGSLSRLDRTLSDQLSGVGLDMSSFDYVAFSHMHFDHVGVANEIDGATLIIQKPEYEAAFAGGPGAEQYQTALFENLKDAERIVIDGDYDVFGDGRVRIISAPGHTPGHQVLLIDLANTGPIMLSGDLYHFAITREKRRVPSFNFDRDMTLNSMERIENLIEDTGAAFWIEHELAFFEQLNKAPAFYD